METEEKLKKRIAYEKMLAGISERAVSVDDLDEFLDESLRRMGGILDVSRIFIFTYNPVSTLSLIHISEPTRQPATSRMPSSA